MRARLFNLASAFSLALCIGVCALWLRSYRVVDVLACQHLTGYAKQEVSETPLMDVVSLRVNRGQVSFWWWRTRAAESVIVQPSREPGWNWEMSHLNTARTTPEPVGRWGVSWSIDRDVLIPGVAWYRLTELNSQLWPIGLATAILPAIYICYRRRLRLCSSHLVSSQRR